MKNLFSVDGKVVVITGGSTGIGVMMAKGFLENGAKVYITARSLEQLEATAADLSQYGPCIPIRSDLSTLAGVEAFATAVQAEEPSIDILINNAGMAWADDVDTFPEAGWDRVMELNVKSVFFLTQKLLPALRAAGIEEHPARVVNIASMNGITHPGMKTYSYSSSKAAVIHLTRHMGADIARDHINMNAIAPGFFPSDMTASLMQDEEALVGHLPIPRVGRPEEIAGTALYLCSAASNYVIGQTVVVDGGWIAQS